MAVAIEEDRKDHLPEVGPVILAETVAAAAIALLYPQLLQGEVYQMRYPR
jgi:hypothetical protein